MKRESRGEAASKKKGNEARLCYGLPRAGIHLAAMPFLSLSGSYRIGARSKVIVHSAIVQSSAAERSIHRTRHPQPTSNRLTNRAEAEAEAADKQSCQTHADRETEMDERTEEDEEEERKLPVS